MSDPTREALERLRTTIAGEVMHWSEDFHPGELPTPDTALVSRLNVFDDIDKALAAAALSTTPAPDLPEKLCADIRPHDPHDVPGTFRDWGNPFRCPGTRTPAPDLELAKLQTIEEAARAFIKAQDGDTGDPGQDAENIWNAVADLRAALEGAPDDQ